MTYSGDTVTLELTTQGYEYEIYPVQEVDVSQRKEAFSIAPPGLSARNNILLGISGMQADIVLDAAMWNDGTDRSNGSAPDDGLLDGEVVTLREQWLWLDRYIHEESFAAAWELRDSESHFVDAAGDDGEDVFIEDYNAPVISEDAERWRPLRIMLRRGESIG